MRFLRILGQKITLINTRFLDLAAPLPEVDGWVAIIYLSGAGDFILVDDVSKETHTIPIKRGRMILWSNKQFQHGFKAQNLNTERAMLGPFAINHENGKMVYVGCREVNGQKRRKMSQPSIATELDELIEKGAVKWINEIDLQTTETFVNHANPNHANPINNFQRKVNEWGFGSSLSNQVLTFWHNKRCYVQSSKDKRHKLVHKKSLGLQTGSQKTVPDVELAKANETIARQANEISQHVNEKTQQANEIKQLKQQLKDQANYSTRRSTRMPTLHSTHTSNQQNGNPDNFRRPYNYAPPLSTSTNQSQASELVNMNAKIDKLTELNQALNQAFAKMKTEQDERKAEIQQLNQQFQDLAVSQNNRPTTSTYQPARQQIQQDPAVFQDNRPSTSAYQPATQEIQQDLAVSQNNRPSTSTFILDSVNVDGNCHSDELDYSIFNHNDDKIDGSVHWMSLDENYVSGGDTSGLESRQSWQSRE